MDWLTREQIDSVLDNLSAADLIESFPKDGSRDTSGVQMPTQAFNRAAMRLGIVAEGERATERVRAADFQYLAKRIGEVINVDSPLSEDTGALLDSVNIGE